MPDIIFVLTLLQCNTVIEPIQRWNRWIEVTVFFNIVLYCTVRKDNPETEFLINFNRSSRVNYYYYYYSSGNIYFVSRLDSALYKAYDSKQQKHTRKKKKTKEVSLFRYSLKMNFRSFELYVEVARVIMYTYKENNISNSCTYVW